MELYIIIAVLVFALGFGLRFFVAKFAVLGDEKTLVPRQENENAQSLMKRYLAHNFPELENQNLQMFWGWTMARVHIHRIFAWNEKQALIIPALYTPKGLIYPNEQNSYVIELEKVTKIQVYEKGINIFVGEDEFNFYLEKKDFFKDNNNLNYYKEFEKFIIDFSQKNNILID